jgi:hypothetical protein
MEIKLEMTEQEAEKLMGLLDYWGDVACEIPDSDETLPSETLCLSLLKQLEKYVPCCPVAKNGCGGCCCGGK